MNVERDVMQWRAKHGDCAERATARPRARMVQGRAKDWLAGWPPLLLGCGSDRDGQCTLVRRHDLDSRTPQREREGDDEDTYTYIHTYIYIRPRVLIFILFMTKTFLFY